MCPGHKSSDFPLGEILMEKNRPLCVLAAGYQIKGSWNSSVGIETSYGRDGPVRGSNSGGGEIFRALQTSLEDHVIPCKICTGSLRG